MDNKRAKRLIGLVVLLTTIMWVLYYYLTSYLIGRSPMPTSALYAYQDISAYELWVKYCIAVIGGFSSWAIQLPGLVDTIIPATDYGLIVRQYLSSVPLIPHIPAWVVSVASVFITLPYYMVLTFAAACIIVYRYSPSGPVAASAAAGGVVRGAHLVSAAALCKTLKSRHNANFLPLSAPPVIMPWDLESRHVMIAGITGSGKSVLLCSFLAGMCRRRKKVIIYDRKGELTSKFYHDDDIIFNPYDQRFQGWSIFNEFSLLSGLEKIPETLVNLANSLFSVSAENRNKSFYDGAASIFKSGSCWLKVNNQTSNENLYNFFTQNPDDIKAAIDSLPLGLREGAAFLAGTGDVRASFLSCLADRIRAFQPFIGRDGSDGTLSIKNWFADESDHRKLILSTASSNADMYLPILTMIIDVIGNGLRDMPEDSARRIYIILDELSSLPPLKTLQMLLREGRSRGASVWLSTQTMASIEAQYGRNNTADIFGLCNSLFIFRTSEPGQSQYFSQALGNAERLKINKSEGNSQHGFDFIGNESKNRSENRVVENIVLPGELQGLPIGMAYTKIGDFPIAKVKFKNVQIPAVAPYFLPIKDRFASPEELAAAAVPVLEQKQEKPMEEEPEQENTFKM